MRYRADIDGLRALSVIAVILFHSGFTFLSGGYVGVDVFFVISGYLITGLVFNQVQSGTFTYTNFYKRRIARLLPALTLTLLLVLVFGFLFYNNKAYDNLGKEVFFSALGAANILFGQGVNYFASEDMVRPLIHLWSLGVEEQFYLVWPTLLILLARLRLKHVMWAVLLLGSASFLMALTSFDQAPTETYFYPQYRAFELLIGALTALGMKTPTYAKRIQHLDNNGLIATIALACVVVPMFVLDEHSTFPGVSTLFPCIGTAVYIACSSRSYAAKLLGFGPLVTLGLISYPLYLYHQPIITYIQFFDLATNRVVILAMVLLVSVPASWLTYRFIEVPIRQMARQKRRSSTPYAFALVTSMVILAGSGLFIAKKEGLGERFHLLNPFALEVTQQSATTFHNHFQRGMQVADASEGGILFVGDSLLQQYVYPLSKALGIDPQDVDTVTRGGCVLLKGVDFQDEFSDISCNDLREDLYRLKKRYAYVVVSQGWVSYTHAILNAGQGKPQQPWTRWEPFIDDTIGHFKTMADTVILIGLHLTVDGTAELSPTIFLTETAYHEKLPHLNVTNLKEMKASRSFFDRWQYQNVIVVHPMDLWSNDHKQFILHNAQWSFFGDTQHLSNASTDHVVQQLLDFESLKALKQHFPSGG